MIERTRKLLPGLLILLALWLLPAALAAQDAVTVTIPALHIESTLSEFRVAGSTWRISPWATGIGHLQGTGWFGNPGSNTVLAGHSQLALRRPGVFADLQTLQPGDEILVQLPDGTRRYLVAEVTNVSMYDVAVVYPSPEERLTLITCDAASYNPRDQLYQRRIVVVAYPA